MFSKKNLYRGSFGTHLSLSHVCYERKSRDTELDRLEQTPWLTSLDIRCNRLKKNGAIWVHNILQANPQLKHLFLSSNDLKEDGLKELADSLTSLDVSLETLFLNNNGLTLKSMGLLVKILHNSQQLRVLNASNNVFESAGALCLSAALARHSNLAVLNLYCTRLGDEGLSTICDYAEQSRTLLMLNIGKNYASPIGITRITKMIASPTLMLQHLNMESNRVTDDTGRAFGEAIANNHVMTRIKLHNCFEVSSFATQCFFEGLLNNDTLHRVSMAASIFNKQAAVLFCQLLRTTSRITVLKYHGSSYDEDWVPPLLHSLAMNRSLVTFIMPCTLTHYREYTLDMMRVILQHQTLATLYIGYRYRPMTPEQEVLLNTGVTAALKYNGALQQIRDFSGTLHTKDSLELNRNKHNRKLKATTFTHLLLLPTKASTPKKKQRIQ